MIFVMIWNGLPKSRSPELAQVRIDEAAKIVELYENRIDDAKLDLEKEISERDFFKHKLGRLMSVEGVVAERDILATKLDLQLAELKVKNAEVDLREIYIQYDLTKVRLKAAALDPDDLTIYVDQRSKR